MITVTLYSRRDCPACDEARQNLQALQDDIPHRLVELFVEDAPELYREYLDQVPVVEAGPYRKKAPFDITELAVTLRAAEDRMESLEKIGDSDYLERVQRGSTISGGDRFSYWLTSNYIWLINLLLLLYVGLPFVAPVLMKEQLTAPANVIYTAYSPLCHQLAFRSFFLYGEQIYYPRQAAGVTGVLTYGQATGLPENDLLAARAFRGNATVGYKVALCERDVAIYASMLVFGVLFALTGRRMKPLHWILWVLIGILPIALDGFSQLFSQLGLASINQLLPYRESTPFLRVFTGALFGFTTAWFGIPYIEESMRETRRQLARKFAAVAVRQAGSSAQEK